jgi:ribosomal protein S27E
MKHSMIRIIKTAPDKTVTREVICRNCGSTLEYTPSDVVMDYYTDYTGGKDYYYFIKCPACTCEVKVIANNA